ncbi:MAG TPA: AAA family ATPase [Acetobacteraceae bacterium]|nr:AAA family ATPase [Acetobacteraceae bacterium]
MIGSRQMERLLSAAEAAGAKVVLVGDSEQLRAIEAGAAFRASPLSTVFCLNRTFGSAATCLSSRVPPPPASVQRTTAAAEWITSG